MHVLLKVHEIQFKYCDTTIVCVKKANMNACTSKGTRYTSIVTQRLRFYPSEAQESVGGYLLRDSRPFQVRRWIEAPACVCVGSRERGNARGREQTHGTGEKSEWLEDRDRHRDRERLSKRERDSWIAQTCNLQVHFIKRPLKDRQTEKSMWTRERDVLLEISMCGMCASTIPQTSQWGHAYVVGPHKSPLAWPSPSPSFQAPAPLHFSVHTSRTSRVCCESLSNDVWADQQALYLGKVFFGSLKHAQLLLLKIPVLGLILRAFLGAWPPRCERHRSHPHDSILGRELPPNSTREWELTPVAGLNLLRKNSPILPNFPLELSLFEFRFTVFFHESPPFSFFKPRKETPPKRPGANTWADAASK